MKLICAFVFVLGIFLTAADPPKFESVTDANKTIYSLEPLKTHSTNSTVSPGNHEKTTHENNATTASIPTSTSIPVTVTPISDAPGDWNITEKNHTCIKITGFINLNVTTKDAANKTESTIVNIPSHTPVTGSCAAEKIQFHIDPSTNSTLQLQFAENKTSKEFMLSRVDGLIHLKNENRGFGKNVTSLITPLGRSYFCQQPVNVEANNGVVVEFKKFRIQAFKNSTSSGFDSEYECPYDVHVTPDIVPIIVGCALAILVVLVLVAYLISRRRSQARGYLSM